MTDQQTLIDALGNGAAFPEAGAGEVEVLETHISWVLLVGDHAYKIKKPVDLGFLDFSTLDKRKFYCEEELRLNRRLAEALYLDVVPIGGSETKPVLGDDTQPIEYAVKMRRFDQTMQLDHVADRGELSDQMVDHLARRVSEFHQSLPRAGADTAFGDPDHVWQPVAENFSQIDDALQEGDLHQRLQTIRSWSEQQYYSLQSTFSQRKAEGFVRECHGDMHLRNIALFEDEIVVFDGIEFNADLRWIDVISEIAFLVMDLEDRQHARQAQRFLNQYLEHGGDYQGVALLRFYKTYRAMVRAKVDAIRLAQSDVEADEREQIHQDLDSYVALAEGYIRPPQPALIINHGVSGSGKTYQSQSLLEQLPAIRVRSDVERKRLFANQGTGDAGEIDQGLYAPEISEQVYAHLRSISGTLLNAGHSVIVDAAFLKREQRKPFATLAKELGVPLVLIHYDADPDVLRQRVRERATQQNDASDADLQVLEHQLSHYEAVDAQEQAHTLTVRTDEQVDTAELAERIHKMMASHG